MLPSISLFPDGQQGHKLWTSVVITLQTSPSLTTDTANTFLLHPPPAAMGDKCGYCIIYLHIHAKKTAIFPHVRLHLHLTS